MNQRAVLASYRESIVPLLEKAGFTGTIANMRMRAGRHEVFACASKRGDTVQVGVSGTDGRAYYSLVSESFLARDSAATVTKKMRALATSLTKRALPRIRRWAADAPRASPAGLVGALEALLRWLTRDREFRRVDVAGVKARGRGFEVRVRGRAKAIEVDRVELVTLMRELRDGAWSKDGRDLRYALRGDELEAYIAELAKQSRDDARALFVHVSSPYDLPERGHPLRSLFPKALYATTKLDVAASGAALLRRALPHVAKRKVVDRVAAAWIVRANVADLVLDPKAPEVFASLETVAAGLAKDRHPLLRECGWLITHEVERISRAIATSRPGAPARSA